MGERVLVVDDDRAIRESLRRALQLEGYEVVTAADGIEAMVAARRADIDVIVLDIGIPDIDGMGVTRLLRTEGVTTPILMLTAMVAVESRVEGLDAGADDYLPKPFDLAELLARLRALLRRSQTPGAVAHEPGEALTVGDLTLDIGARRVFWQGEEIVLSKTEFDLLELLASNSGRVLTHSTIYERIWQYDFGPDSNNLAAYVSYVRKKLIAAGAPDPIRTVRGVGYSFEAH